MALLFFVIPSAFADKGTFVDEIKFIQYLDENTALEEVRNGNLDLYYFRVSSDRLEDFDSRKNLQVFESTVAITVFLQILQILVYLIHFPLRKSDLH